VAAAHLFQHASRLEVLNVADNPLTIAMPAEEESQANAEVEPEVEPVPELDPQEQLTIAVHHNEPKDVATALARGANPNKPDSSGVTALISAAHQGFLPVVKKLLKAGALLSAAMDVDGSTAFHAACQKGHTDVAVALVNAGCNVSAVSKDGRTGDEMAEAEGYAKLRDEVRHARKAYVKKRQKMREDKQAWQQPKPESESHPTSPANLEAGQSAATVRPDGEDLRALYSLRTMVSVSSTLFELNLCNCGLDANALAELLTPARTESFVRFLMKSTCQVYRDMLSPFRKLSRYFCITTGAWLGLEQPAEPTARTQSPH